MTESLKTAVNQLVKPPRVRNPLPAAQAKTPIPASVGFAKPQAPAGGGGNSAGIASPLVETKRTSSVEMVDIISTDGFIVLQVPQRVTVTMRDANQRLVDLQYING